MAKDFGHIPIEECGESLLQIEPSEFILEPKYFEQGLIETSDMYLREGALKALRKAQTLLPKGHHFKLWDCYRPMALQEALFVQVKEEVAGKHPNWNEEQVFAEARKFIAIPDRSDEVPPHCSGGTVDLTVVNESGEELNFGTEFDEFTEECHAFYYEDIIGPDPAEQAITRNRETLVSAMTEVGFIQYEEEWWHFDYGNQLWAMNAKKPHAIYGAGEPFHPKA